jgi:RND family efflux transporter MFP subunit
MKAICAFALPIVCLSLLAPALSGCRKPEAAAEKPPTLVSVQSVQSQSTGEGALRYSGSIQPYTRVSLAFKVGGYVQEVAQRPDVNGRLRLLQQGDRVTRGTVLAQVQQADYSTRVAQSQSQLQGSQSNIATASSQLAQATATREQARSGVTQAESSRDAAQSQLAAAQAALVQAQTGVDGAVAGKKQAQASLVKAEAGYEKARLDFERATNLFATQSLTKADYDTAKAQNDSTRAQVDEARQQIAAYQAKEDQSRTQVQAAQAEVATAKAQVRTSQSRIVETKAQLRASEDAVRAVAAQVRTARAGAGAALAQLQATRIPLQDTAVRAPLDAVVLQRTVEIGSLVSAGSVVFVLADMRSVKVVFGVPDVEMRLLRLGMPLTITTEAYPGREFGGKVTAISPSADLKTRVFDVEVTVPNPRGQLKSGMVTTLELPGPDRSESPLTVPVAAIVGSEGGSQKYAVFVVEDQGGRVPAQRVMVARAHTVTLGPVLDNKVVIRHGLTGGERVVTTGAALLIDGEVVRVVD